VQEPSYRVSAAGFNNDKGIEEAIPSWDRYRAGKVHHNKLHFRVMSVAMFREGKTMGFGICATTTDMVKFTRCVDLKSLD